MSDQENTEATEAARQEFNKPLTIEEINKIRQFIHTRDNDVRLGAGQVEAGYVRGIMAELDRSFQFVDFVKSLSGMLPGMESRMKTSAMAMANAFAHYVCYYGELYLKQHDIPLVDPEQDAHERN